MSHELFFFIISFFPSNHQSEKVSCLLRNTQRIQNLFKVVFLNYYNCVPLRFHKIFSEFSIEQKGNQIIFLEVLPLQYSCTISKKIQPHCVKKQIIHNFLAFFDIFWLISYYHQVNRKMGLVTPVGISGRTLGSVSESGFEEGSQQRHKKRYFFDFFKKLYFSKFCKFVRFSLYFSRFSSPDSEPALIIYRCLLMKRLRDFVSKSFG